MPKIFTSKSQKIGELGEEIATLFHMKQGFEIIDRNYTKKWGEIDIIAQKGNSIHFIEVKSVSWENISNVTHETGNTIRPEDNMHPRKLERMYRTIETYLMDKNTPESLEWQIDLVCVYLDQVHKKAKIKRIENIIG
jgi:putative endonuclease